MLEQLITSKHASIYLIFVVLVLSSVMMHPSFASIIALIFESVALVALRLVAHIEGAGKP